MCKSCCFPISVNSLKRWNFKRIGFSRSQSWLQHVFSEILQFANNSVNNKTKCQISHFQWASLLGKREARTDVPSKAKTTDRRLYNLGNKNLEPAKIIITFTFFSFPSSHNHKCVYRLCIVRHLQNPGEKHKCFVHSCSTGGVTCQKKALIIYVNLAFLSTLIFRLSNEQRNVLKAPLKKYSELTFQEMRDRNSDCSKWDEMKCKIELFIERRRVGNWFCFWFFSTT